MTANYPDNPNPPPVPPPYAPPPPPAGAVLPYASAPVPGAGLSAQELYAQVHWMRRNGFNSALVLIALALWILGPGLVVGRPGPTSRSEPAPPPGRP